MCFHYIKIRLREMFVNETRLVCQLFFFHKNRICSTFWYHNIFQELRKAIFLVSCDDSLIETLYECECWTSLLIISLDTDDKTLIMSTWVFREILNRYMEDLISLKNRFWRRLFIQTYLSYALLLHLKKLTCLVAELNRTCIRNEHLTRQNCSDNLLSVSTEKRNMCKQVQ